MDSDKRDMTTDVHPSAATSSAGSDAVPESHVPETGRERLAWNVLASWGAHLVFIAAGFVLPRLIDERIGQTALGIWDFGWSVTAYLVLALGGVISSVNRYVAHHRARADHAGLNQFVSSVTVVLGAGGLLLTAVIALIAWALPALLSEQLTGYVTEARWVVCLLGLSIVAQTVTSGFVGVLTGCHRWDLHHGINSGAYALTVVGMITALLLGGGLVVLAVLILAGEILGRVVRCVLAYRVCPELRVRWEYVSAKTMRETLTFGGKSFLPQLGEVLMTQTVAILVVVYLGPASLAAYSRPRSLVRHVATLVQKFAMVLTPTASSFQSAEKRDDLRDLLVKSTRYAVYVSLPMVLTLVIFGGPILRVWMGPRYENGTLLAVLVLAYLTGMLTRPALHILIGLNAHGRAGAAILLGTAAAIAAAFVALGPMQAGLIGAAVAIGIPMTITYGVYLPLLTCRELEMPLSQLLRGVFVDPLRCVLPFTTCLLIARLVLAQQPLIGLGVGLLVGGVLLAIAYWRNALPPSLRESLAARFGSHRTRSAVESPS